MEFKTRISTKGQIVIPKEIREKYGFRKGVEVIIKPLDETRLIIKRAPRLSELFGFLGEAKATEMLLEERKKEIEIEEERISELEHRGK